MFEALVQMGDRRVQETLGGEVVQYTAPGQPTIEPVGVFDDNYFLLQPGDSMLESETPTIWFRMEDLNGNPSEDRPEITVRGITYVAYETQTDGVPGQGIRFLLREVGV